MGSEGKNIWEFDAEEVCQGMETRGMRAGVILDSFLKTVAQNVGV